MGRGILSGLGLGGLVSVLVLAAMSLMVPPPPAPSLTSKPVRAASPAPLATPEASAGDGSAIVDAPPAADRAAIAPANTPETTDVTPGIVEIPAGSEFARGAGDLAPARPEGETAPTATQTPGVLPPESEPAPALADTTPSARPEAAAPGSILSLPAGADRATAANLPEAESPVPVPPPGEVETPMLAPVADQGTQPEVPASAPMTEAMAGRAPEVPTADLPNAVPPEGATPEGATPDAAMPEIGTPGLGAPDAGLPETDTPETDTPETDMSETDMSLPDAPAIPEPGNPSLPPVFSTDAPEPPFGVAGARSGFANVPGIKVNRLPNLANQNAESAPEPAPILPPIRAYSQPFDAAGDQPLFSVLLVDPGTEAGGLDRATLKTIDFPVTIAIDPNRADAAEAAADFRAAGFEVAILASGLPAGATIKDLEVSVEAWRRVISEAVAVVEPESPVYRGDRQMAQQLVGILAREGIGLIAQGNGLNPGWQQAEKAAMPRARIWRVLDGGRDKAPVIKRTLERAGFEAARGQSVVVMLHAWPESVAGLTSWQPEKNARLVLAPVSAVALREK